MSTFEIAMHRHGNKDHCWNCQTLVNSENHNTCPSCGSCRLDKCMPSGIEIYDSIYKIKKKPIVPYVDFELEYIDGI
jgi:hypothetical protein